MAAGTMNDTRNSARKTILGCRRMIVSGHFENEAMKTLMMEQSHHTLADKNPK
jgi:hypothetical protein